MEEKNWLEEITKKTQMRKIMDTNSYTARFGIALTQEDAGALMEERKNILIKERRVEFGESILPKLIYAFCDSDYVTEENFKDILSRLQGIFYLYKNEMEDEISDDELIGFMKEQFETVCFGDLDYLEGTCLEIFANAVRAGYREYRRTEGRGEYAKFDEVTRWDRELYLEALKDLF